MKKIFENKRLIAMIFSLFLLAISIILLLVFFLINKDNSIAENKVLRLNASDITMYKGDMKYDYYELNNKDAILSFEVDKEGIIDINENRIFAISNGTVNVTITATYNDKIAKDSFVVCILNHNYSYIVKSINNCKFYNGILEITSSISQFSIEVYGIDGNLLEDADISYTTTNNAVLQKQMGNYILFAEDSCQMDFYVDDIDYSFSINVILNY